MVDRLVRLLEIDASILGRSITAATKAGLSGRAEDRIAKKTREEMRDVYLRTINDAFMDGGVRSGNARNIMRAGVRVFGSRNITNLRGYVLGPSYIAKQNEGGVITPKNSKKLAIPLDAALRPDGTPKLPGPRSWSNIRNTFIYKSKKNGRAYIAYNNGPGGRLVLLYALVDRVELSKNKGFLDRPFSIYAPQIADAFADAFLLELSRVTPSLGARAGLSAKYDRRIGRRL
jgi:hypothetical protein